MRLPYFSPEHLHRTMPKHNQQQDRERKINDTDTITACQVESLIAVTDSKCQTFLSPTGSNILSVLEQKTKRKETYSKKHMRWRKKNGWTRWVLDRSVFLLCCFLDCVEIIRFIFCDMSGWEKGQLNRGNGVWNEKMILTPLKDLLQGVIGYL